MKSNQGIYPEYESAFIYIAILTTIKDQTSHLARWSIDLSQKSINTEPYYNTQYIVEETQLIDWTTFVWKF